MSRSIENSDNTASYWIHSAYSKLTNTMQNIFNAFQSQAPLQIASVRNNPTLPSSIFPTIDLLIQIDLIALQKLKIQQLAFLQVVWQEQELGFQQIILQQLKFLQTAWQQLIFLQITRQRLESLNPESEEIEMLQTDWQQLRLLQIILQQLGPLQTDWQQLGPLQTAWQQLSFLQITRQRLESLNLESEEIESLEIALQELKSLQTDWQRLESLNLESEEIKFLQTVLQEIESLELELEKQKFQKQGFKELESLETDWRKPDSLEQKSKEPQIHLGHLTSSNGNILPSKGGISIDHIDDILSVINESDSSYDKIYNAIQSAITCLETELVATSKSVLLLRPIRMNERDTTLADFLLLTLSSTLKKKDYKIDQLRDLLNDTKKIIVNNLGLILESELKEWIESETTTSNRKKIIEILLNVIYYKETNVHIALINIKKLPPCTYYFEHLQTLYIDGGGELTDLQALRHCECLKKLTISNVLIEELPEVFSELSLLESLKISHCPYLKRLPIELLNCAQLKQFEIEDSQMLIRLMRPVRLLYKQHPKSLLLILLMQELYPHYEFAQNIQNLSEVDKVTEMILDLKNLQQYVQELAKQDSLNEEPPLQYQGNFKECKLICDIFLQKASDRKNAFLGIKEIFLSVIYFMRMNALFQLRMEINNSIYCFPENVETQKENIEDILITAHKNNQIPYIGKDLIHTINILAHFNCFEHSKEVVEATYEALKRLLNYYTTCFNPKDYKQHKDLLYGLVIRHQIMNCYANTQDHLDLSMPYHLRIPTEALSRLIFLEKISIENSEKKLIIKNSNNKDVYLDFSKLSNLQSIRVSNWFDIKHLSVKLHSGICTIQIDNCPSLISLEIDGAADPLTNISLDKNNFPHLKQLDLSNTKITQLPSTIAQMTTLETLILNNTQVQSLSKEILDLPNLNYLGLRNIQINNLSDLKEWAERRGVKLFT